MSATQQGVNATLNAAQAQKILDHAALRLELVDESIAERLLDAFVDRLRRLGNIAVIKGLIARADDVGLKHLGGVEEARALIEVIERIVQD